VSIEVPLDELAAAVAARDFAYLLTTGDDGRPRAVALRPHVDGRELTLHAGARTGANAAARPDVSLVFPPTADDAFSLVVDGSARVDDATGAIVVTASWAVRHRPAS
jgi:hypothetical protein